MATVLLVDDDLPYRRSLRAFLDASHDLDVVADTGDGAEAIHLAAQLRPDAVVVDLAMPGLDGVEVAARVMEQLPDTVILLVTGVDGGDERRRAAELGTPLIHKGDPLPIENALRHMTRRTSSS
ncbi:MAG TPA: response regulator transcription factor [Gaiellaceae bacterium]